VEEAKKEKAKEGGMSRRKVVGYIKLSSRRLAAIDRAQSGEAKLYNWQYT
jgi:hypothetical protein